MRLYYTYIFLVHAAWTSTTVFPFHCLLSFTVFPFHCFLSFMRVCTCTASRLSLIPTLIRIERRQTHIRTQHTAACPADDFQSNPALPCPECCHYSTAQHLENRDIQFHAVRIYPAVIAGLFFRVQMPAVQVARNR